MKTANLFLETEGEKKKEEEKEKLFRFIVNMLKYKGSTHNNLIM